MTIVQIEGFMGCKKWLNKASISLFLLFSIFSFSNAQQSLIFDFRYPDYVNALDLYEKEKYVPAQKYFEKVIDAIDDNKSEVRIESEFYQASCALELFHENAELLLSRFIQNHPLHPRLIEIQFNLAKFQFRKRKYKAVINQLASIDPLDLKDEERSEYYFKMGYSYFQEDDFDKASKYLYEIKDTDNPYVSAARYYYGHISYANKKYQTAAENFIKVSKDRQFGPLAPYYLTQIYYLQGKYEQLVRYAPAVLDSAPPKRENEIRKFIGDAYFELGKYDSAVIFLDQYLSKRAGVPSDYYQLGYSYKQLGDYEKVVNYLQKAIGENDTINQSAYYFIGESNIKLDRKYQAKNAFRSAEKIDVDKNIKEDALFNFAKVAYELSYHPYDDAILAFEEYINKYPNSDKLESAYEYLLGVYYTTKNYKEALNSLNRIDNPDFKLLEAKQRIALFRGIELYNEDKYQEAIDLFEVAIKNNYNPLFKSKAIYWKAECFYKLKDYDNAINFYTDFLSNSGARSLDNFNRAYYNLAYTYYDKKKYASAIFWFKEYVDKENQEKKGLISDANVRIGDSYFIQKDYADAISYYEAAADFGLTNADYSLLQTAISYGVLGDYDGKAKRLLKIINERSLSVYTDDAIYELAKTYLIKNKNEDALAYYNQLLIDYPNSTYSADANLKIGLIHYNNKNDDIALNSFNKVVKEYPNTGESKEALEKIRKIYIDKGDANGFEDYISGVPFASISKSKLDSTSYVIAENNYLDGNCEKAVRDFTNYLKRYPNGLFKLNAHFYRAECELKGGFIEEAAMDYEYVLNSGPSKFLENTLLGLGEIYLQMNKIDSAINIYSTVLNSAERESSLRMAESKLMTIYYSNELYKEAKEFAYRIVSVEEQLPKLWHKARMILAKSYFEVEEYDSTISQLDYLLPLSNEIGAEAKYLKAKVLYLQGEYPESDTLIYELVDQVPSYPYWIANGFILLADNFIAKEDLYNARITFQSVIDNADDSTLVSLAKEKLRILEKNQKEAEEPSLNKDTLYINLEEDLPEISPDSTVKESLINKTIIRDED